jgi:signal transduction histidine kinase
VLLDLKEPVGRSVSLLEAGLRQKGIAIRTSVAPSVPRVRADPDRIEQVLVNLIWNAVDAMPHGGGIDISLHPGDAEAELVVRDEGKGIAPEHLERVFEPFFTTKPRGKGTGLGLAICRRIVEEARGRIGIGPAAGGGTEVRIHLPAAEDRDG